SDGFCAPVIASSCTRKRSVYEDDEDKEEEPSEEAAMSYFSVPSFILYEVATIAKGDADSTVFFDTSPSQIKDFLFAQVLGTRLDLIIQRALAGFKRWDAVYMLHIAQHEYVFENSLAFFPFYPMTIRLLSMALAAPFVHFGFIHVSSALLISAVAINLGCFLIAAALLYRIVLRVSRSVKQAIIAVLLFSANPASIFFSAAYTESLYCMLTFAGICVLLEDRPSFFIRYLGSLLCFGLAYATRSNGLINIGYVGFFCLIDFMLNVDHENPRRRRVLLRRPVAVIVS
ncbi:hypothetical protein OSTOST_24304, partial [Ostertagia ostertagi]